MRVARAAGGSACRSQLQVHCPLACKPSIYRLEDPSGICRYNECKLTWRRCAHPLQGRQCRLGYSTRGEAIFCKREGGGRKLGPRKE